MLKVTEKKSSTKVKVAAATNSGKKATRKKRVGNVRALILKALNSGAKTRSALQNSTGASYNALVTHLTRLRAEGVVKVDGANRLIALAADAAGAEKPDARTGKTLPLLSSEKALVAGYSPRVLNEALDAFNHRLKPIHSFDEKVLVLDQLSGQIGGAIGEVLGSIKADLMRISGS